MIELTTSGSVSSTLTPTSIPAQSSPAEAKANPENRVHVAPMPREHVRILSCPDQAPGTESQLAKGSPSLRQIAVRRSVEETGIRHLLQDGFHLRRKPVMNGLVHDVVELGNLARSVMNDFENLAWPDLARSASIDAGASSNQCFPRA